MPAGHLAQRHGDDKGDAGADDVGDDDPRACDLDGGAGAEQQSRADGSAHRHHGHLSGSKLAAEMSGFRAGRRAGHEFRGYTRRGLLATG